MIIRLLIMLSLLLPIKRLSAQVIENGAVLVFNEFPFAEVKHFAMGNYGFDSKTNTYNPKYFNSTTNFQISFSTHSNITGKQRLEEFFPGSLFSKNQATIKPNLTVQHWRGRFLFHLSYSNNIFLARKNTFDQTLRFGTESGFYQINFENPKHSVEENSIQLALSTRLRKNLSISLGVVTNNLLYSWGDDRIRTLPFEVDYFDNLQYLISLNYNHQEKQKFYFLYKSENSNLAMKGGGFYFQGDQFFSWTPTYSLYGLLGYGFQTQFISPKLCFSFEMRHSFLEDNDKPDGIIDIHPNFDFKGWNNELILGLNFKLNNKLKFGALYSYFVTYKSGSDRPLVNEVGDRIGQAEYKNPLSVVFSSEFLYKAFSLNLQYQFAAATTEGQILRQQRFISEKSATDIAHFVSLGIGYRIFAI